ncbi:hypothetical protein F5X96DRAFT_641248 [Biscogniauxia mediterranea]|nr:hypothetical protein F5X96DRAFT_641248 [Biscogniauxia mediterranea]
MIQIPLIFSTLYIYRLFYLFWFSRSRHRSCVVGFLFFFFNLEMLFGSFFFE